MMPRETTHLPVSGDEAFIGAAGYFAVLAYPDDLEKRDRFVNAVKAMVFKYVMGGRLKSRVVTNKNVLAFRKERELNAAFKHAIDIIMKKRMFAWETALLKMAQHTMPVTMADGSKFSINKMIKQRFPDDDLSAEPHNKDNAYRRVWTPSKSVVHLMFGLQNHFPRTDEDFHVDDLFLKPDWLPEALENAEGVRKMICMLDGFNIEGADTIQLLPED